MSRKNNKRSWLGKVASSWKEFLKLEALNYPLAIAIIQAQKKMLKLLEINEYYGKASFHRPPKKQKKNYPAGLGL